MDERDASMDDILASIRAAVMEGPSVGVATPPVSSLAAMPDVSAESAPDMRGLGLQAGAARIATPDPGASTAGSVTVDAFVRAALEPMLKAWLDAHLPEIVDRAAQAEIARLIGRGG